MGRRIRKLSSKNNEDFFRRKILGLPRRIHLGAGPDSAMLAPRPKIAGDSDKVSN